MVVLYSLRWALEQYKEIGFSVLNSSIWKFLTKIPLLNHLFPQLFCALTHISQNNEALARAVKNISNVGICHNDLKPKNVLWEESGKFWIIDWEAVGLFDIATDHLDTALAWSTHYVDGNLNFFPEKMAVFFEEYPFKSMEKFDHSLQLVTIKWCYWLIFCLRKLFLFPGQQKINIWNMEYEICNQFHNISCAR